MGSTADALVAHLDRSGGGRVRLLAPAVGRWLGRPSESTVVGPGTQLGRLVTLNRSRQLVMPGGVRGGSFWAMQLRWGKVLTAPHGPGPLRGTLEYAFEIVPAMVLRQAGAVYGGGFNPFFWQYNFTAQERLVPYVQMGAGMLWTSRDFPAGTSSFNFTPQGGLGAYWVRTDRSSVAFGVRFHHISNAGIKKPNPGHNALYFYAGLSWWR